MGGASLLAQHATTREPEAIPCKPAIGAIEQGLKDRPCGGPDEPTPSNRLIRLPKYIHTAYDHTGRENTVDLPHNLLTRQTVARWVEFTGADVLERESTSPAT